MCSGESEVIGSWKIIETRPPRIARIAALSGASAAMSTPSASPGSARNRISPPEIRATDGRIPITDCEITDFPDPDSPTSATVFPCGTRNDTPSTARSTPVTMQPEVHSQIGHFEDVAAHGGNRSHQGTAVICDQADVHARRPGSAGVPPASGPQAHSC